MRYFFRYPIRIIAAMTCLLFAASLRAQEPGHVEHIWGARLVNHQTTSMLAKGQTAIYVIHYFAPVSDNGISDLFGIYGTANIQMGAEHAFGHHFSAFFLTEKINKTQELGFRFRILSQDRAGENPVSMTASFSVSAEEKKKKYFGVNYYFIDRFFYTTQLSVSRQLKPRWEMMISSTLVHFNMVPENSFSTYLSLDPSLAFRLNRKTALFASFDFPLGVASASEESPQKAKPVMTWGTVMRTPTHNFQLFISNGYQISPGKEYLNNHTGFSLDALRVGFNIQVKLGKRR